MNRFLGVLVFLSINASVGCDPDELPPPAFAAGCAERGGVASCTARGFDTDCRRWTCSYTSNLVVLEYSEEVPEEAPTEAGADGGLDDGGIDATPLVPEPFGRRPSIRSARRSVAGGRTP